jgi:glycosyltransferase involved in cell wall biosynthesis
MKFNIFMKRNSNILITEPTSPVGGINTVVDNIVPFFKHNVIIAYRGPKEGRNGVKYNNKFESLCLPLFDLIGYVKKIIQKSPEYIIINTSINYRSIIRDGIYVKVAKFFHKKVLLFIHGFKEDDFVNNKKRIVNQLLKADMFLVLSDDFKDKLIELKKIPINVVYNSVEKTFIQKLDDDYIKNKDYSKEINILFISRIVKEKGIFTAIKAFEIIKQEYENITLTIAGDGLDLINVKKYVQDYNIENIVFLGNVIGDIKVNCFKQSNILLFPSHHNEGLPVVLLEAMQAGLAIVITSVGGIKDLYRKHNFGVLIEKPDVDSTINALRMILKEDIKQIGVDNHFFAQVNFSPSVIAKQIENILESI